MRHKFSFPCVHLINISIHAPRERCDAPICHIKKYLFISIHAPRERCDWGVRIVRVEIPISIHAPRERCDHFPLEWQQYFSIFQSTHRVSDATETLGRSESDSRISIHAPRERCDVPLRSGQWVHLISIHAPRERCDVLAKKIEIIV